MVPFLGGTYNVGDSDEKLATVPPFCLDKTKVTVGAYRTCVLGEKCPDPDMGRFCNWGIPGRDNHPINCVDWVQAKIYCAAQGKRLPTEMEWEWAARGAERGTTYPWGEDEPLAQLCWSKTDGTCPVGRYSPAGDSPQGIRDLAGDVWEWTSSKYSTDESSRVTRGGCWSDDDPANFRATYRNGTSPMRKFDSTGFRCAKNK
jgi:formylglycine-generating enzyme required for sulfatase activity